MDELCYHFNKQQLISNNEIYDSERDRAMKSSLFARKVFPILLVTPALLLMALLMIYPVVYNASTSLTDLTLMRMNKGGNFIGLANYATIFGGADFQNALLVTLIYVVATVSIQIVLAFLLALMVFRGHTRGRKAVTIITLLPKMVTPVAISLVWRFMLNYETGVINYFLECLGLSRISFLTDSNWAMVTVVLINVWQHLGFSFLLLVSGMINISPDLIEASRLDGASLPGQVRYLILPIILPVLSVALMFAVISSFQVFDTIYMTTGGGPAGSTMVLGILQYRKLFIAGQFGVGSAMAIVLLALSLCISMLLLKLSRREAL